MISRRRTDGRVLTRIRRKRLNGACSLVLFAALGAFIAASAWSAANHYGTTVAIALVGLGAALGTGNTTYMIRRGVRTNRIPPLAAAIPTCAVILASLGPYYLTAVGFSFGAVSLAAFLDLGRAAIPPQQLTEPRVATAPATLGISIAGCDPLFASCRGLPRSETERLR